MKLERVIGLSLCFVCLAMLGCSTGETSPCGEGGSYDEGATAAYCSYIVIVGGFECPAAFQYRADLEGGALCASEPIEVDEVPLEVCAHFSSGCTLQTEDPDSSVPDANLADASVADATMLDGSADPDASTRSCTGLGNGLELTLSLPGGGTYTQAQLAGGVGFGVQLSVSSALSGVLPVAQDAGRCGDDRLAGLIYFVDVSGGDQKYCLCDVGNCGGFGIEPVDVAVGEYTEVFSWDGRNWEGPSDFNNPKGEPFPPGQYLARASVIYKLDPESEVTTELAVECPVTVTE